MMFGGGHVTIELDSDTRFKIDELLREIRRLNYNLETPMREAAARILQRERESFATTGMGVCTSSLDDQRTCKCGHAIHAHDINQGCRYVDSEEPPCSCEMFQPRSDADGPALR